MQQPIYSIVQVTDQLNVGGAEQVVVLLANLLKTHGHTTAVITTVAPGPLATQLHAAVQLINLKRRWKWNPITMYRLVKVLRRFDVVHVHSSYNLRYVYLASRLFFLQKPIFYHEHYGDIHINARVAWHQALIYPNIIFIAVSKQLAVWATEKIKIAPERVFILQNTIIKQQVKPADLPSLPYRLLLVANIRRTKNVEFAIELLKHLNSAGIKFNLSIVGQVNDAVYYKEIKQLIDRYSMATQVEFINSCTAIQPILQQYHLAIHTSKSETGPLVLIEYLAQCLPFITYHTGEVVEQIQAYLLPFIMHDFNVANWVQAIQHAVALPRNEIAVQLSQLYQHHFSPEVYYQQCIAIYTAGMQKKW